MIADILSFNAFITQDILIFFYYIGVIALPVLLYYLRDSLFTTKKFFWFVFILLFVCIELCWRMLFEAMIGYFDMHDYLHVIAEKL